MIKPRCEQNNDKNCSYEQSNYVVGGLAKVFWHRLEVHSYVRNGGHVMRKSGSSKQLPENCNYASFLSVKIAG